MYTLIKLARGKVAEVNMWMWIVSVAFVVYFMQSILG
jgi:xanthine/uracil/vitamin C permease (AzgA family)